MPKLAIIGGSGLAELSGLEVARREVVKTPYGEPSAAVTHGIFGETELAFLARHGDEHRIPPHKINYRANIWALEHAGVETIIAVAAVGGIHTELAPGSLVIPHQIIDYTWSRPQTFFEGGNDAVVHIDFTSPYSEELRGMLLRAAGEAGMDVAERGVYGVTQGPRLETAAEIDRLDRDGCDIVGMTAMPEAALARELHLEYAACAVVVNAAAGRGSDTITMESIEANLNVGMEKVRLLLEHALPLISYGAG
jgi:5'-deoxy-5'-methylthioadenosine phosphorylase